MKSSERTLKQIVVLCACFFGLLTFLTAQTEKGALGYYTSGKTFQDNRDWYRATEQYLEAVRINPAYGQAWFALAECSYALGEYDLALGYLTTAARYLKAGPAVDNLRGFIYTGLHRLDQARTAFTDVLKRYPNDAEARFGLAELDLFDGKLSGAESLYHEALQRQPESRRALLSLALVSHGLGKAEQARQYINQALRYHSDSADVHYFAAYLSAGDGQWKQAENRVRSAIQLNPSHDASYELLASILYAQQQYEEVIDICDYRISRNRSLSSAWYLKGLTLSVLKRYEQAILAFRTGLEIAPDDDIMRSTAERLVTSFYPIEDNRRKFWADWHIQKARDADAKYLFAQASYEYRQALTLVPQNTDVRLLYANLLLRDGKREAFLSQLQFIKTQGDVSVTISDTVESYESLLRSNLAARWDVDPFYLDKTRWTMGVYYLSGAVHMLHPDSDRLAAALFADTLSSDGTIRAVAHPTAVKSYSDAFRLSRENGHDYFAFVSLDESEREITLACTVYVARTGGEAAHYQVYRTGNDRFPSALRRIVTSFQSSLPRRGTIIARNGYTVLTDLGSYDSVAPEQTLQVIKKGFLHPADNGMGVLHNQQDILGTITLSVVNEDISQGTLKHTGFYDITNIGDEVLLVNAETQEQTAEVTAPDTQIPALVRLIQSISQSR